jgi:hypothetical protein
MTIGLVMERAVLFRSFLQICDLADGVFSLGGE